MEAARLDKFKFVVETELKPCKGFVYVILNHVDPDSLGAHVFTFIFTMLGVLPERIKVLYAGKISDEQNSAIVFRCELIEKMEPLARYADKFTVNDRFILFDSASAIDGRLKDAAGKFTASIIIDHHEQKVEETENTFVWIEKIGACSTLLVELVKALGLFDHPEFKNHGGFLPTVLAIGIHADTKGLIKCQGRDRRAFVDVSELADENDLEYLINYQVSPEFMEALARAITNKQRRENSVVASVGELAEDESTIIARVADFFIRTKGFNLVLVWGLVDVKDSKKGDKIVMISARALGFGDPLDEFLHKRFGDDGGAKSVSKLGLWEGGTQIQFQLGFWNSSSAGAERLALIEKVISDKFFSD